MIATLPRLLVLVLGLLVLGAPLPAQQAETRSPHEHVGMRMIGHAVLLSLGDSSSLVLPVQRVADSYLISFGTEFAFVPEKLVATVDSVMASTRLSADYVVEVERCGTREVVHSYEHRAADTLSIMPCTSRALPSACYALRVTLLAPLAPKEQLAGVPGALPPSDQAPMAWILAGALVVLLALLAFVLLRRKAPPVEAPKSTGVAIGAFLFDRAKLELSFQDQRTELSAKEAELLHLLHGKVNETVAREQMLKEVWGNNSDYVGRTLDVFVSKLRKKLEADPNVRIANIRGVGYRLILDS
jgi:hypothetical protein